MRIDLLLENNSAMSSSDSEEGSCTMHIVFMRGKFVAPGAHLGKQKLPKGVMVGGVCCAQQLCLTI